MKPRRMLGLLIMMLTVILSGCATIRDFKEANAKVLEFPDVWAAINVPKADGGQQKYLILNYRVGSHNKETLGPDYSKRYIALPMTNNLVPEPLNFSGPIHKENLYSIEKDIPVDQQKALLKYHFPPEALRLGEKFYKNKMFNEEPYNGPLNNEASGIYHWGGLSGVLDFRRFGDKDDIDFYRIKPYWTSEPFLNKHASEESRYYSMNTLFESPAKLTSPYNYLIIPSEIPRPESDRRAAMMWACIKLPLNIGIDCVSLPVFLILYPFWPKS